LLDPTEWRELNVLCWITPEGETLITKARFNGEEFSTGMVPRHAAPGRCRTVWPMLFSPSF
jgi:hypothetical protein